MRARRSALGAAATGAIALLATVCWGRTQPLSPEAAAAPAPAPEIPGPPPVEAPPAAVTPAPKQSSIPPPPAAPADLCGADELAGLVGKPRREIPVPIDPSRRRVYCTTCPVTQDYQPGRLDIVFDAKTGLVTAVKCG